MTDVKQQRRLTTILAADIAGYSRMMADDEESTLRTLKAHRTVVDGLIARHEGRIFNTAGDSVVAEFGSAVEAVRCAITIQDELRVRNAQLDEKRRMNFRIGLNVGDVLVDGTNLYGDGVNVAARLESIAQPGGICISGSVFALVKNKLSYGFEDIGPQQVKNIPEPVSAFRLTPGEAPVSAAARAAPARSTRSRTLAFAAGGIALTAAVAVGVYLVMRPTSPVSPPAAAGPSAVPANAPDAATLERMRPYAGMTVHGLSRTSGRPFAMALHADGTADVRIELATAGRFTDDRGRWWIEANGAFCVHFHRFAGGNTVCRPLNVEDGVTKAYTWDRRPDPWEFKK